MRRRSKVLIVLGLALVLLPTVCERSATRPSAPPAASDEQVPASEARPRATAPTAAPSPAPSTTATASRALEVQVPLTAKLPHTTAAYVIDFRLDGSQVALTITLRAVLNRPDQRPRYLTDLRAAKAEALAWLANQGYAGDLPLTWVPALASTL